MKKDFFASLHQVLPRLVLASVLMLPGLSLADTLAGRYQVFLQSADQSIAVHIADIVFEPKPDHTVYLLEMNDQQFGDYFLSMRPFKCMKDDVNMLCHLAYPYDIDRRIDNNDLAALEHDFLFIRRKSTDYGIDPWNGLIYRLQKIDGGFLGQAHEVDLNILAVPPDSPLPLKEAEIHEISADQLWLPRLLIKGE